MRTRLHLTSLDRGVVRRRVVERKNGAAEFCFLYVMFNFL